MRLLALPLALLLGALTIPSPVPSDAAETEGGSSQVKAQSGCLNEWMFNGMWRVRVTKVVYQPKTDADRNGWLVTMQWGNGTALPGLMPTDTNKQDMVLQLKNGDTHAASETTDGTLNEQKLDYHQFPASGQYTFTQGFVSNDDMAEDNPPAKLLVTFDVAAYKKYHGTTGKYWNMKTPGYNYRFDLTCDKGAPAS